MKEAIYANRGNGPEERLGDLSVCVQLVHGAKPLIAFSIAMPDSGQVLQIEAPLNLQANGDMAFRFDNDGWGNSGVGTLRKASGKAQLTIEPTAAAPDAIKNIRRNYGTYMLPKGECAARIIH